jgi:hypothetical protein
MAVSDPRKWAMDLRLLNFVRESLKRKKGKEKEKTRLTRVLKKMGKMLLFALEKGKFQSCGRPANNCTLPACSVTTNRALASRYLTVFL